MKKIFIITIAFISFQFQAQEQPDTRASSREAKRKIVPGFKIGANRSNVYNVSGEALAPDRKHGFAAGAFVALPVGSFLGIQPEVIFQQKGFEGSGRLFGESYAVSRTTTHIDIPVQLQVKLFKWFSFLVGPNYSYMLRQGDTFTYHSGSLGTNRDFENTDLRRSTFGTVIGIDINFGHLVLSGRSGWDVSPSQAQIRAGIPDYRNRWIQGTIGYRFY